MNTFRHRGSRCCDGRFCITTAIRDTHPSEAGFLKPASTIPYGPLFWFCYAALVRRAAGGDLGPVCERMAGKGIARKPVHTTSRDSYRQRVVAGNFAVCNLSDLEFLTLSTGLLRWRCVFADSR